MNMSGNIREHITLKEKIEKYTTKTNTCWLWSGRIVRGYGVVWDPVKYKEVRAHRAAWELVNGPIPKDMCICHKCDIRNCVNPDHLFLGTQNDNIQDKVSKNRQAKGANSGAKLYPDRLSRGDNHYSRTRPELLARGNRHGLHLHPEKAARGEKNGSYTHPEKRVKGENHGNSILTENNVHEIRRLHRIGIKQIIIANKFGVARRTINNIINGNVWAWLPEMEQ